MCIVQSYLQWLQDSDYSPTCTLCVQNLMTEECVRLTCFHVFHFACLNRYAQQLPQNTAPAGYTCPSCNAGIFPQTNMVSPVADKLREILSKVNWARAGLGLSLIEETERPAPSLSPDISTSPVTANGDVNHINESPVRVTPTMATLANLSTLGASPVTNASGNYSAENNYTSTPVKNEAGNQVHSVISVDQGTSVRGQEKSYSDPRKLFDSTKEDIFNLSHDHDDDKYRRRPAMDWLNRWIRSRDTMTKRGQKKDPMSVRRKFLVVLVLGVIGFLTLIVIFSRLGRNITDDDPFLDPMANPNIRVQDR